MESVVDFFSSERFCLCRTVLTVVGSLYMLKLTICFLKLLANDFCAFFLAQWGICRTKLRKYGQWAVVTGASEGIGRGYALELARQGLDVVLMSRSEEKLNKVADEIKEKHGRKTMVVPVDFNAGLSVYAGIEAKLKDLDIGVLVNNVGLSYSYPDFFCDVPVERLYSLVELNCQSMVQMTHIVLAGMAERKRGVIVNLSSISSNLCPVLLTVYSASKVFVNKFSDGIRHEYSSKGILVQNVRPGFVSTAMSRIRHPKYWAPSGEQFGRSAVATIGIQRDGNGYWYHALMFYLIKLLGPLEERLTSRTLLNAKKRHQKKMEKMEKKQE